MTTDLKATLIELGFEYEGVVSRLQTAQMVEPPLRNFRRLKVCLRAAAWIFALVTVSLWLMFVHGDRSSTAKGPRAYQLAWDGSESALAEIVRTQCIDGGWGADFLTMQNAMALKASTTPEGRLAYRKAVRNLRVRGLL